MRFWDSSAVIPLLVRQAATDFVDGLRRKDPAMTAWWGTAVESASAITRLEREQQVSPSASAEAFRRLKGLRQAWVEIQPGEELRETAIRFLRVHPLHAADALQLAAAFLAAERRPSTLEFVCLDERLSVAAQREGFPLSRMRSRSGKARSLF